MLKPYIVSEPPRAAGCEFAGCERESRLTHKGRRYCTDHYKAAVRAETLEEAVASVRVGAELRLESSED